MFLTPWEPQIKFNIDKLSSAIKDKINIDDSVEKHYINNLEKRTETSTLYESIMPMVVMHDRWNSEFHTPFRFFLI